MDQFYDYEHMVQSTPKFPLNNTSADMSSNSDEIEESLVDDADADLKPQLSTVCQPGVEGRSNEKLRS